MNSSYLKAVLFSAPFVFSQLCGADVQRFHTIDRQGRPVANEPDFNSEVQQISLKIDALEISKVRVNVVIKPESDNASFDSGNIVEIPRTMVLFNHMQTQPHYKTTEDALAVYAHEYGHAVFDAHIVTILPEYEKLKKIKNEISQLALKPLQENLTPVQMQKTQERISKLQKDLLADKELVRVARLTMPYHEVFADTIAVFILNDKSAIYEALYYEGERDNGFGGGFNGPGFGGGYANPHDPNRHIVGRDFGRIHDVTTWTNNSEHSLFSPLRSVIGSDECWPTNQSEQKNRLLHLLKLLLSDLKKQNETKQFPNVKDNIELMSAYKNICR